MVHASTRLRIAPRGQVHSQRLSETSDEDDRLACVPQPVERARPPKPRHRDRSLAHHRMESGAEPVVPPTERMLGLSDALFGIAITFLALDFAADSPEAAGELGGYLLREPARLRRLRPHLPAGRIPVVETPRALPLRQATDRETAPPQRHAARLRRPRAVRHAGPRTQRRIARLPRRLRGLDDLHRRAPARDLGVRRQEGPWSSGARAAGGGPHADPAPDHAESVPGGDARGRVHGPPRPATRRLRSSSRPSPSSCRRTSSFPVRHPLSAAAPDAQEPKAAETVRETSQTRTNLLATIRDGSRSAAHRLHRRDLRGRG